MQIHGILVIDKPAGITSRDAINRVQRWFPRGTRIGHTGTLDPLATGVLVVCIGVATRLAEFVQDMPKNYRAGITLGGTSDTDDADGVVTTSTHGIHPTPADVQAGLSAFVGPIQQVPPAYSAAKVAGRRAYDLARKGKDVALAARQVTIHGIDIQSYAYPHLDIDVHCGKGTYIRSLARDLGGALGCGGYIHSLRRTRVGWFSEADALSLDSDAPLVRASVQPPWRAVQETVPIALADNEASKLCSGQRVPLAASYGIPNDLATMAVVDGDARTIAIVELNAGWMQPIKVFPLAAYG